MMNGNTERKMDEQYGVYEVDYYWIDGYNNWHRATISVVADDGAHAMDIAQAMVYMPYGANGAEYLGQVPLGQSDGKE